jgi:hypothetical protein
MKRNKNCPVGVFPSPARNERAWRIASQVRIHLPVSPHCTKNIQNTAPTCNLRFQTRSSLSGSRTRSCATIHSSVSRSFSSIPVAYKTSERCNKLHGQLRDIFPFLRRAFYQNFTRLFFKIPNFQTAYLSSCCDC